ncbi:tetratricopeptide repeat (TPR)-like superfamily protein [Tasmannia lanceolata]|uniref:tetratricopeptide repeat (TPR)-like superfamily protein n=1 Tax=Tasmannia lanceolata TaxID=3420 RepID=UPI0040640E98
MALLDSILQKCTSITHIKQLHAHIITTGLFQIHPSRTKLLEFCSISAVGNLDYAAEIFRRIQNPVTNDWNALIRGLAQSEQPKKALQCYLTMSRWPQKPDPLTCSFALKACARVLAFFEAKEIHAQFQKLGFDSDVRLQTTLIDVYVKSGDLDGAHQLFDEMPLRDIATWNALISGLAQGSRPKDALALFRRTLRERVKPNDITVVGALSACSQLGALSEGKFIHSYLKDAAMESNVRVCNALIDMYAKCGSINGALEVFHNMVTRTLVSWNTIIMGLAMHGRGSDALEIFDQMGRAGVKPDQVTYLSALCACNHSGLVEEGLRIFNNMVGSDVSPNIKHYGCIVDILGRAGRLEEAYIVINSIPMDPDPVLWQSLLGACKTYGNVGLAERASEKLAEMGSNSCGDYVLMSNVYAADQRWDDVGRVREEMKSRDVRKVPGFSFIELKGVIHKFVNGDHSHMNSKEIYGMLDEIRIRVKGLGYVPNTAFVLHDIGEEEKENALVYHSEKLAVAYGLISSDGGDPIRVIKNLRICGDCHVVFKMVSKIYGREIMVRDRARYHHFKDGSCSCGDFW